MSWRYKLPTKDEYETEQEYEDALESYYSAMDNYCDEYKERRREL